MFFKKKSNVIYRDYNLFGYITDNRNFGYKQKNHDNDIGDKIVSESGAVFLSILGRDTQSLSKLVKKISLKFPDVDIEEIKSDAIYFYLITTEPQPI